MFIYVDLVGSQTLHQGALFTLITSAAITGNTAPTWIRQQGAQNGTSC